MDISSIFPVPTNIKATITHEFESISEYNGLEVPPIFELPVLYPASGEDIQVMSVYDSEGKCNKTLEPFSEPSDTSRGSYFNDLQNRKVIVYPRAKVYENHYEYTVSVTFDFGNNIAANVTFGLLMPYEEAVIFNVLNVSATGDWKQNVTQSITIEFWLPEGTRPYQSNDYTIGNEDGRYVVRFVDTSSKLESGKWQINFYVVRLYNFFIAEVVLTVTLAVILIVMAVFRKRQLNNTVRRLICYLIPLTTGSGLFAYEFYIIGDWIWNVLTQKLLFTILLLLQACLAVAVFMLAQKWQFGRQTTSEAA
jgi:hypothetical protein